MGSVRPVCTRRWRHRGRGCSLAVHSRLRRTSRPPSRERPERRPRPVRWSLRTGSESIGGQGDPESRSRTGAQDRCFRCDCGSTSVEPLTCRRSSTTPRPCRTSPMRKPGRDASVGFGKGLAHGFLLLVDIIRSLFDTKIGIYETPNAGERYNLGFFFGVVLWYWLRFFGGKK